MDELAHERDATGGLAGLKPVTGRCYGGDHGLAPATTGGTAGLSGPATYSCMTASMSLGGSGVQNSLLLAGGRVQDPIDVTLRA